MAICSNNSYVIFAGDEFFNDTYVQSDTNIVNDIEFAVYTGQNNGATLWVKNSTYPGSITYWKVQATRNYGQGDAPAGYVWVSSVDAETCPINFSKTNFTIGSTQGAAFIATSESLRSTRQKLYVSMSSNDTSQEILNGEYTLQPDAYNNFSWWKNEDTGAVIVGNQNGWGEATPFVAFILYISKTDADGRIGGISFLETDIGLYSNTTEVTPPESRFLNRLLSYQPFQSPLPENEDYDALVSFFGRDGVSFEFNDLDKYSFYTFKGENGIWRGTTYNWEVDLNISVAGNILFLEWIKSLQRGLDYKINGKKIFLNKKSEKLKSIKGFIGSSTLELAKIDTSSLALNRFRLQDSKINTIVLGDVVTEVTLNNVTNLDSEPIDLELKGVYDGALFLSAGLEFNSFIVQKTNAFAGLTTFEDYGSLNLLDSNTQEALIEKLVESEAVVTAKLYEIFTDEKIEAITNPAIKEKVITKKVIVLDKIASGSGSGSSGTGGAVGINVLDYITNDSDKIIWDYMENRFEPYGNYLLKNVIGRPLISTEIENIFNAAGPNYSIIYPSTGIIRSDGISVYLNSVYVKPQQYSINSSSNIPLYRAMDLIPDGITPSQSPDFVSVIPTYSSNDAAVAAIQKYENTTGLYFYDMNYKAQRTPKKLLPAPEPFYYEMYDDGKIYKVQGNISSSAIKYSSYSTNLNILTGVGDTQSPYTLFATGAYDMFAERPSAVTVLKQNNNIEIFYPYFGQRLQYQLPNSLTKEDVKNIVINTTSYPADIRIHLLDNSGNLYYSNTLNYNSTVPWQIKDTGVRQITYNDGWYCVGITNNFDLKKYEYINFDIYPSGEIVSGNKYRLISPKYAIRHFE